MIGVKTSLRAGSYVPYVELAPPFKLPEDGLGGCDTCALRAPAPHATRKVRARY